MHCSQCTFGGKDEGGFTLVELIVAVGVMAIGILGATSAIFVCEFLNEDTHRMSLAIFAAEEKLNEVVMGLDWDNGYTVITVPEFDGKTFDVPGLQVPPPARAGAVWVDDTTSSKIYYVTIRVDYNRPNSTTRQNNYEITTTIYRK